MTITRKYYENLLDLFDELCKSTDKGVVHYFKIKRKIGDLLDKLEHFHLLKLNLNESFFLKLISTEEADIQYERIDLLIEIYDRFLNTSIDRDSFFSTEPNYLKSIELSLINLPYYEYYEIYKAVQEANSESHIFQIHLHQFPKFHSVATKLGFEEYKESLNKDKQAIRKKDKLKKIEKEHIELVRNHFEEKIKEYKSYIFDNYPSLISQFKHYNNFTRVYFSRFKDNGFFLRIYVYDNLPEENNLYIHPYNLDFNPTEAENIEEIDKPIISGLFTYARIDEDFGTKYRNFFSLRNIHSELLDIYIHNASKSELVDFIIFLLKTKGYNFNPFKEIDKKGFDYAAIKDDETYYFQFLTNKLKNIDNLKKSVQESDVTNITFISPYRVFHSISEALEKEKIKFISLYSLAYEHFNNENGILIHWYIQSKLKDLKIRKNDLNKQGDILIKKLETCKPGKEGWREYEGICTEIFEFLFKDSFRKYTFRTQSHTFDEIFRRDLIVNNTFKSSTSFWSQIKSDFNANVIIIDFKNYGQPLEQNELYIPTKYINSTTGNFALLFTRKGINESSVKLQKRLLEDKKLILSLNDTEVIDMIREKILGEDVSYVLDNKRFLLYENK